MKRLSSYSVRAMIAVVVALIVIPVSGCTPVDGADTQDERPEAAKPSITVEGEDMATIYLAGGCFWGVEKLMASIHGVAEAESGYANGTTDSPTYRDVVTGQTGHAETVRVAYDPSVAPLPFLLEIYYQAIDPTSLNRQGNDVGTQYRTGIYYSDPADAAIVERSLSKLQEQYDDPVVVEAEPLTSFTAAEEYHQDYLEKNPGGYCHIPISLFQEAASAAPDASHFRDAEITEE